MNRVLDLICIVIGLAVITACGTVILACLYMFLHTYISMSAEAWAGWVAGLGSIGAIATLVWLRFDERKTFKRERRERARVVVYRILGWVLEIRTQLERLLAIDLDRVVPQGIGKNPDYLLTLLEINSVASIKEVLDSLHDLEGGAAELAQLDWHVDHYNGHLAHVRTALARGGTAVYDFTRDTRVYLTIMNELCERIMESIRPVTSQSPPRVARP